jgi:hypothetical protein
VPAHRAVFHLCSGRTKTEVVCLVFGTDIPRLFPLLPLSAKSVERAKALNELGGLSDLAPVVSPVVFVTALHPLLGEDLDALGGIAFEDAVVGVERRRDARVIEVGSHHLDAVGGRNRAQELRCEVVTEIVRPETIVANEVKLLADVCSIPA